LGVRYPDLQRDLEGPRKYASLVSPAERAALRKEAGAVMAKAGALAGSLARMPDWAKCGVAALITTAPHPEATPRLLDLLAEGGVKVAAALNQHFEAYPRLRAGFDTFYTPEAVEKAAALIKEAAAKPVVTKVARPVFSGSLLEEVYSEERAARQAPRSKVAAYLFDGAWSPVSELLDDDDKITLVRDGLLIKDARPDEDVSVAYKVDVKDDFPKAFSNPDATGLYDVLNKDGDVERCLIVRGPKGSDGTYPWSTVVRLDAGKRAFLNAHDSCIWTRRKSDSGSNVGINDGSGWWDDLEGSTSDDVSDDAYYIAVGPGGEGSVPFRVHGDAGDDAGGGKAYSVSFDTYVNSEHRGPATRIPMMSHGYHSDTRVHLGQRTGTKLRYSDGDLYIPEGYKLLRLAPDQMDDDEPDTGFLSEPFSPGRSRKAEPLRLGDALAVETGILRKTAALAVSVDGLTTVVNGRAMSTKDATIHLVKSVGLREDAARAILEDGAKTWRVWHKAANFRVKVADPYQDDPYLTSRGPNAPAVLDPPSVPDGTFGGQPTGQAPFEQGYVVDDMLPGSGNRDSYRGDAQPDPGAVQMAQQAADSGQRELFDTSMIGSLLKSTSDDAMVDRYMPDQMKALHNWGCMLLEFHWNRERFADRYGEAEMPELEDSLRNTFETSGRTILFLRRKTTVAAPDEDAMAEDLGEVAD
jgi:hypothetical protein